MKPLRDGPVSSGGMDEATIGRRFGRKLVVIMFTDMVGYSTLTQRDEAAALRMLEAQSRLLEPILVVHSGRLVRTMGDGTFVEFESAVHACQAALEMQQAIAQHNRQANESDRFQIRVGIHLGDVEVVGDDLLGHGVNVAARLEPLAEPGGICVSEDVARQVRGKVGAELVAGGTRTLKGIDEQIQVFFLSPPKLKSVSEPAKDLPKVAVLPFATQGGDPEQEFFGDGLSDEILWALAKVRSLKTISRTSCFAVKNSSQRVGDVGKALSVDYVLEGSVRRAANRVRIAVQFVKVADDTPVWSDRYDRELEDIFAIQEEITQSVVDVLQIALSEAERGAIGSVPTRNLQAYDCYLKAKLAQHSFRFSEAITLALEAIALDPKFAKAHAAVAGIAWGGNYFHHGDGTDYVAIARESAICAIAIDPHLAESHLALAYTVYLEGTVAEAKSHLDRALALDPQNFDVMYFYATVCHNQGKTREMCEFHLRAAEVRPDDYQCLVLAGSRLLQMDDPRAKPSLEEAISRIRRRIAYDPDDARAYCLGAGALLKLGQADEARTFAERAIAIDPSSTTLYNIACFFSTLGDCDKAIDALEQAYQRGLRNAVWIENDHDMDAIRGDQRVQAILAMMRADEV